MYIKVRVIPGAKREQVTRVDEHTFEMTVREPAERNLANRRVCQLVADALAVRPRDVRIISGHHGQSKMISVNET